MDSVKIAVLQYLQSEDGEKALADILDGSAQISMLQHLQSEKGEQDLADISERIIRSVFHEKYKNIISETEQKFKRMESESCERTKSSLKNIQRLASRDMQFELSSQIGLIRPTIERGVTSVAQTEIPR